MNRNWQDYQKEIADDRYYYVRSCIRQNFFPGSEKAFLDIMHDDLARIVVVELGRRADSRTDPAVHAGRQALFHADILHQHIEILSLIHISEPTRP